MYAEHSAVVIMILSRLFHERFSGLGSVVFDFFFLKGVPSILLLYLFIFNELSISI